MAPKARKGKKGKSQCSTRECCVCYEAADKAPLPQCGHDMCSNCGWNTTSVCMCAEGPTFCLRCPQCRGLCAVTDNVVKYQMAEKTPSHAKVMQNTCGDGTYVVVHKPCDGGCYACNNSEIVVRHM